MDGNWYIAFVNKVLFRLLPDRLQSRYLQVYYIFTVAEDTAVFKAMLFIIISYQLFHL